MNSIEQNTLGNDEVNEHIYNVHRNWGETFQKLFSQYTIWRNPKTKRRLRIGYLSADFFTHSVSYFIEAPLRYANNKRTFVICYANIVRRDLKTQRLERLAHGWREIFGLNAEAVSEIIRKDKIDILVELTGHTAGNRLDVTAMKPAPVQVTWIGYPNSTGQTTIDYRITDSLADPPETKQQFTEELVRLNDSFLCYTPARDVPQVGPAPVLASGRVTFGSFNNLAKVNDTVLDCWCAILLAVPRSRMLLKCKPFACTSIQRKMMKRFTDRKIESHRIDLIPLLPTTAEHLKMYSLVDISLDTFPYAGTTTTCEALYMGVPVVTLGARRSPNHAHNVGVSLLSRISGCEQLISWSLQEYIEKGISLGNDHNLIQVFRKNLRPSMLKSPLCDGATFTRGLEDKYEWMWDRYCSDGMDLSRTQT